MNDEEVKTAKKKKKQFETRYLDTFFICTPVIYNMYNNM